MTVLLTPSQAQRWFVRGASLAVLHEPRMDHTRAEASGVQIRKILVSGYTEVR
jgi:hypothetical protein